jgi:polysaccharide export outer membrane protein
LATYAVSNELIDRGDVLDVMIVTSYGTAPPIPTPVRVGEDGVGSVPLIGQVQLAGLELEGAEQAIAGAAVRGGIYRDPHVTVTLKRKRTNTVTVIGAVKEPGVYHLPRGGSSLLAAVVTAGGLAEEASGDIEIRRPIRHSGGRDAFAPLAPLPTSPDEARLTSYAEVSSQAPQTMQVNLFTAAKQGNGAYNLDDGDVVMVTKRSPKTFHVMGLVREPGQYELPLNKDLFLLEALSMAGGRTLEVADTVWLLRRPPGENDPVRIKLSVRDAKVSGKANLRLAAGDIISVEETPITFVVDTLGRFVRVGFSSGLPLF